MEENQYTLIVGVYDMGGQSLNSFGSRTDVVITVKENLWINPPPVKITENSTQPHPVCITEVGSSNHQQVQDQEFKV